MDVFHCRDVIVDGRNIEKLSDVQEIGSPEGENGEPSHLSSIDDRLKGMTNVKGIASPGSTGSLERQNADPLHLYEQLEAIKKQSHDMQKKLSEMHKDIINLKDEVRQNCERDRRWWIGAMGNEICRSIEVGFFSLVAKGAIELMNVTKNCVQDWKVEGKGNLKLSKLGFSGVNGKL